MQQAAEGNSLPRVFSLVIFIAAFGVQAAWAHEYYLMPQNFSPQPKQEVAVKHLLGQKFKGNEIPYIQRWNIRSEVWEDGKKREVKGKDGDRPALLVKPGAAGLTSVVHQSNIDILTFKTWEKFEKYARKEGLEHALLPSEMGTKPKVGLVEAYARYAKTLLTVDGDTNAIDQPVGLKIELVALANPLALSPSEKMPVQLLYDGVPLANGLIKVFIGVGNEYSYQIRSDANGKAMIPAEGKGPYLLNAIHMTEPQSEEAKNKNSHWESFWASLTFERGQ